MTILILAESCPVIATIKSMTKAFAEAMKESTPEERKEKKLGPAHRHAWNGFLTATKALADKRKEGTSTSEAITKYCAAMSTEPTKMDEEVKHCSVANAYRKDVKKVQVSTVHGTDSHHLWKIVVTYLVTYHKADLKEGRAPQGDLERRIQTAIDEMGLAGPATMQQ